MCCYHLSFDIWRPCLISPYDCFFFVFCLYVEGKKMLLFAHHPACVFFLCGFFFCLVFNIFQSTDRGGLPQDQRPGCEEVPCRMVVKGITGQWGVSTGTKWIRSSCRFTECGAGRGFTSSLVHMLQCAREDNKMPGIHELEAGFWISSIYPASQGQCWILTCMFMWLS